MLIKEYLGVAQELGELHMYLCLFVSIIESQYDIPVGWIPQQTSVDGLQLVGELQQYTKLI